MAGTETAGSPAYAPVWKRAVAVIVDVVLVGIISGAIIAAVLGADTTSSLLGLVVFLAYYIGLEATNEGQTVGKLLLGIRAVKDTGEPLDGNAAAVRNILRIVDVLPAFYIVGLILIVVNDEQQRLGDMLGDTHVVEA